MLKGIKKVLHFWGFYDEPTPTPQYTDDGHIICPFCNKLLVTNTEYEIHIAIMHGIDNGYEKFIVGCDE